MKPIANYLCSIVGVVTILFAFNLAPRSCRSFEISKVFSRIRSSQPTAKFLPSNNSIKIETARNELLQTISSTNNGKDSSVDTQMRVLSLVDYLETNKPVSNSLLTNPTEAEDIDGIWYLQYTQPSEIDADEIKPWTPEESSLDVTKKLDTRKANNEGSISFLGRVAVDTSNKLTTQTIGVKDKIFANAIKQNFGTIEVKGYFELDSVPNRIIAAFDNGTLTLNNGFVLDFSFLFSLRATLNGGLKAGGWLETTYLDNDIRIGRGNLGSLFVLTRDKNMVIS